MDQQDIDADNHTHSPYHAQFNDILTEYPVWSTDTTDIENTNKAQHRENRQEKLNTWQKDTPVKTQDNRQVLDNIEAYAKNRLGLTENSLPGAQSVAIATVQSDLLTTDIPNYSPNSIASGQQDDDDYQDDREEDLYQVDGTMDVQTPNDDTNNNKEIEPDNTAGKR